MRYVVDPALCSGHGQCFAVAPQVYTADDDGFNAQTGVEVELAAGLAEQARRAADTCPDAAIQVLD